jgi:hypothetical protein
MVVGSRYVEGGGTSEWGFWRPLLSWLANRYVGLVAGVPIRDTTSGFRAYRREVLEETEFERIKIRGYVVHGEMAYQAWIHGFRLGEVPILFRNRARAASKLSGEEIYMALVNSRCTAYATAGVRGSAPRGWATPEGGGGLVVWGGGSPAPARDRQREGALVVAWPGAPAAALERAGVPFRLVEEVLGPEGQVAADGAARTWARVWGRLPLADGKSFRELVEWRGSSLLWSATAFLHERTAGPWCARTAELAFRLLEATAASEVDAPGLAPAEALLLSRACTVRGVLFHGRAGGGGRPLPVVHPARRSGLGRLLSDALAPATPPALPAPAAGTGSGTAPVLALVSGEEETATTRAAPGSAPPMSSSRPSRP